MHYDIGYAVSALLFMCIMAVRFLNRKQINSTINLFFGVLLFSGILDISLDIVSAVMLSKLSESNRDWTFAVQQIFYLFQLAMPYMYFLFVFMLAKSIRMYRMQIILCTIPLVAAFLLWAVNPWRATYFYIDEQLIYQKPVTNVAVYMCAGFYLACSLVWSFVLKKKVGHACFTTMLIISMISGVFVFFQAMFPQVLLTGVGIAMAVTIMFLYFHNADSFLDSLTGCFDRTALLEYLANGVGSAKVRYGVVVALDGFQGVNFIFGHDRGDRLLKQVASYLKNISEKEGFSVYRIIGDTFMILGKNKLHYQNILDEVSERLKNHWLVENKKIHITACICGIEDIDMKKYGEDFPSILEFAVEKAKKQGPGTNYQVTEKLVEEYRRSQALEKYLHTAVRQNLFYLVYQPIWSVQRQRFIMLEALVRLKHPEYGNISPVEFIPMAEKNGMITDITNCVLEQVTDYMKTVDLETLGIEKVKINLSPMDLILGGLEERIMRVLENKQIPPEMMSFEVTETAATHFDNEIRELFRELRNRGISLSLDDFGSGYANLDSVMKLNFDTIKIDRSMLLDIEKSAKSRAIYSNMVKMMKGLGLKIISEGAETEQQVELLKSWNVDAIQGFYFSKPITQKNVEAFLEQSLNRTY